MKEFIGFVVYPDSLDEPAQANTITIPDGVDIKEAEMTLDGFLAFTQAYLASLEPADEQVVIVEVE